MIPDIPNDLQRWKNHAGSVRTLKVRWLLNPGCEPVANAAITDRDGIITDIRPLSDSESADVLPLVLLPPLVNVHTHLEFSHLAEPLQPARPFQQWIRTVMLSRADPATASVESIGRGLHESQASGVRLLGEICTDDGLDRFADRPDRIVAFRESIGLTPDRVREQLLSAEQHLSRESKPGITSGLSPHAPYTVHPDLLNGILSLAEKHQAPVAMHVAETTDEIELLTHGRGRFVEFLNSLGLFDTATFPGGRCVLDILRELSRACRALVVHGNYLTNADVEFLSRHPNLTTVYCPRTHAFFGHSEHPLRRLRAAGCRVVLATDSRASNPDLNVFLELLFVARHFQEIPVGELVAMITTHAAESMGIDPTSFELRPGGPIGGLLLSCEERSMTASTFLRRTEFGERGLSSPRGFTLPSATQL